MSRGQANVILVCGVALLGLSFAVGPMLFLPVAVLGLWLVVAGVIRR